MRITLTTFINPTLYYVLIEDPIIPSNITVLSFDIRIEDIEFLANPIKSSMSFIASNIDSETY